MKRRFDVIMSMMIIAGLLFTQGGLVFASELDDEKEEYSISLESDVDDSESTRVVQETVEVEKPDYLNMTLPVIDKRQKVFDFIVDPSQVINATDAVAYDGAKFEEGSFFFKNSEGEYNYSTHSDKLKVENRSSVPLEVNITLEATGFDGVVFSQQKDFSDDTAYVYIAIEDSDGNEIPVDENGIAAMTCIVPAAFEPEYVPVSDEETGEVHLEMEQIEENVVEYLFGITGACNNNEDWANVQNTMTICVTWEVGAIDTDDTAEITINKKVPADKTDEDVEESTEKKVEETEEKSEEKTDTKEDASDPSDQSKSDETPKDDNSSENNGDNNKSSEPNEQLGGEQNTPAENSNEASPPAGDSPGGGE